MLSVEGCMLGSGGGVLFNHYAGVSTVSLRDLPKTVQEQVIRYLESDNFRMAKQIYDLYINALRGSELPA